jgi:hypothetical protein
MTNPTGMTIDPVTGLIEWTPDSEGDFNVAIQASNSAGVDYQGFVLSVSSPLAPTITSTPVVSTQVNAPYSYDVDAIGNPAPTFALSTAPSGMTIDDVTGLIQWTPGETGDFSVVVEAANSSGTDTQPFTLSVTPEPEAPLVTSTPVTDGVTGQLYSYDVEASGYPVPTFYLAISPDGMTINETTGLIEWTPPSSGDFDVKVKAVNGINPDASQTFIISVSDPP